MTGDELRDEEVALPGGPLLAVRRADGARRPFLLVHGLSSNARLWDGVSRRLADAGHQVVAVDLRGHGRSEQTADGHTTDQAADDLAALCAALALTGDREPVVAGQSWGGNVALSLAARHGGVAGLALVDGGWLAPADRYPRFDECWEALAPPAFRAVPFAALPAMVRSWHPDWPEEGVAGTIANFAELPDGTAVPRLAREHHREIVRSLWEGDPRSLYPRVTAPVLIAAAVPHDAEDRHRAGPAEALRLLPHATASWYTGADHDLHAQQPDRLAADLLALARQVEDRLEDEAG